jgi:hypothetical protein
MTSRWSPRQTLALGGLLLAFAVALAAAAILTAAHTSHHHRIVTVTDPAAPSAVIGTKPPPPALSAKQLEKVRVTARRFLASYLPVLYGRRSARTITHASAHVRAELSAAAKSPRAPRNRRPRVTKLTTRVQSSTTVVAIAIIADTVAKPYQIVFQLSGAHGGWQVTELANY